MEQRPNFKALLKVKFFTLGCKVNQYETQGLRERLLRAGYRENNSQRADVYIINTCTVTEQADRESCRLVRKALRENPRSKIIVTGCLVEKNAREVLQLSDRVQIIPQHQKHQIINFLNFTKYEIRNTNDESFIPLSISDFQGHQRAFVKIQDGCNNFCSFCKVPLVRGRSRSRSLKEIISEVERLKGRGFKEIVLTGICLGDYRYRNLNLVNVLASLEKIKGEFRIRLSSIEPQLVSNELVAKIADSARICPHLHIPLQSGDNQILKMMNRRYTVRDYLSLIAKIKKKIKDVAITTDVLVGFPQEAERHFRNTVRSLKEVSPLRTHIFSFSPREGTAAFKLNGRIAPQVIKQRMNLLKQVTTDCSYKFRRRFLGKNLTVLIESQAGKESGTFCGYSENYIRVIIENATKKDINSLLSIKVKTVDICSTRAQCCQQGIAK